MANCKECGKEIEDGCSHCLPCWRDWQTVDDEL
jgi:predicted amidophosphoribosyltransferase